MAEVKVFKLSTLSIINAVMMVKDLNAHLPSNVWEHAARDAPMESRLAEHNR